MIKWISIILLPEWKKHMLNVSILWISLDYISTLTKLRFTFKTTCNDEQLNPNKSLGIHIKERTQYKQIKLGQGLIGEGANLIMWHT